MSATACGLAPATADGATITEYSAGITPGSSPFAIAAGPDGNLWFTEDLGDRIRRITTAGVVPEFSAGVSASSEPRGIRVGSDGNLWFGEFSGNRIGTLAGEPGLGPHAMTTATSSSNPSVFGQAVTYAATVSLVAPGAGAPTGTVTFFDGDSPIGTAALSSGRASFTTSSLAAGSHDITASYGGDGNANASTGTLAGNPQVTAGASGPALSSVGLVGLALALAGAAMTGLAGRP